MLLLTRIAVSVDTAVLAALDILKAKPRLARPVWPFATRGVVRAKLSKAENEELDAFLVAHAAYKTAKDTPFVSRSKIITDYLTAYFQNPSPLTYEEVSCSRTSFTLDLSDELIRKLDEMVSEPLPFEGVPDQFLSAEAIELKKHRLFPNRSRVLEQILKCQLYACIKKS